MMKRLLRQRLRIALYVLAGATVASFLSMLLVQSLMGGIRDIQLVLGRSFMIGFGLAVFVFFSSRSLLVK